ncbi:hypothetical protein MTP03_18520 [Tsukamurella sp. PLM1]|nr:hypothetical protein MTP03_18520 [Tsukamurella sp. PLM1]
MGPAIVRPLDRYDPGTGVVHKLTGVIHKPNDRRENHLLLPAPHRGGKRTVDRLDG